MATTKSPGIYFHTTDESEFSNPEATISTTVAIVGFAKKGPVGVPTEITTYNDFKKTFGTPIAGQYSGIAVKNVLTAGGTVLFYRVADETKASVSSVILKNEVKARNGMAVFNSTYPWYSGAYSAGAVYAGTITDKDNGVFNFNLRAPASGKWSKSNIKQQLVDQLAGNPAYFEYKVGVSNNGTFGFSTDIVSTDKTKYSDKYLVSIGSAAAGDTLALAISNTFEKGTGAYTKLYVEKTISSVSYDEGTKAYTYTTSEALGADDICIPLAVLNDRGKSVSLKIDGTEYQFNINVTSGKEGVTFSDLATQLTAVLTKQLINVYYIPASDSITVPYFLFISKDNTVKTISVEAGTLSSTLFHACGTTPSVDDSGETQFDEVISEGETANGYSIGIHALQSVPYSKYIEEENYPLVEYLEDSDTIVSSVEIKEVEFPYLLGTGEVDGNAAELFATVSEQEPNTTLTVSTNTSGQVFIEHIEESAIAPVVSDNENKPENYLNVSELFDSIVEEMPEDKTENDIVMLAGQSAIPASNFDMIAFKAQEVGSGTNSIGVIVATTISPIDGTETHTIYVYNDKILKETFENVSYDTTSDNYFVKVINEDPENGGSNYISVEVIKNELETTVVNMPDTSLVCDDGIAYLGSALTSESIAKDSTMTEGDYDSYDYALGNDGVSDDSDDIFESALDVSTSPLANKDMFSFHILITPDNINETIQDDAIALCEEVDDAIYITDPPQGLSKEQVINWHNGKGDLRGSPLTSLMAATYWPWCKIYDSSEKKNVWVMPSVVIAPLYCTVDDTYGPQYAPAGEVNGVLSSVIDIEKYPNRTERDELYVNNRVNPIVKFRSGTIMAYGEKTLQRKNSTLTKVHTVRMLNAMKKEINSANRGFIFMPNVESNLSRINANVSAILEKYKQGNGISKYTVICDKTNNTDETLQMDLLYCDIFVTPVGCIEQVEINFTVESAATTTSE